jgi:CHAT domain-containing protein
VSAVDAGDEVHGLVRGVLAAGARDLVASLWRVGDAATAEFMVRLHTRIAAGDDAAAALAAVQCEAAAAGQHPWTWAGFALHTRNAAS